MKPNTTPVHTLLQEGFTLEQASRLLGLRAMYNREHGDMLILRRWEFLRWLYQQGKLES